MDEMDETVVRAEAVARGIFFVLGTAKGDLQSTQNAAFGPKDLQGTLLPESVRRHFCGPREYVLRLIDACVVALACMNSDEVPDWMVILERAYDQMENE